MKRICSSLGYDEGIFPYLDYKVGEFNLSDSFNTIMASIKEMIIDYDSIVENKFNTIICKENMVK